MKERKEQFQKLLEEAGLHGKYVILKKKKKKDLFIYIYSKLIFFI